MIRNRLYRYIPAFTRGYANKLTASSPVTAYGEAPRVAYTENHEWIAVHKDNVAFVGITDYAAEALGDVTFVELTVEPQASVDEGESIGSVESVKSASDLYCPAAGTVLEINETVVNKPALVNKDPMGSAWLAKIKIGNQADLDKLLTFDQYDKQVNS